MYYSSSTDTNHITTDFISVIENSQGPNKAVIKRIRTKVYMSLKSMFLSCCIILICSVKRASMENQGGDWIWYSPKCHSPGRPGPKYVFTHDAYEDM